jgi:hypothetical protein
LQQEEKQKSESGQDKSANIGKEKGNTANAARCVARARAMLKNVGAPSAIAIGATDCGYGYLSTWGGFGSARSEALRKCRAKTTDCRIVD